MYCKASIKTKIETNKEELQTKKNKLNDCIKELLPILENELTSLTTQEQSLDKSNDPNKGKITEASFSQVSNTQPASRSQLKRIHTQRNELSNKITLLKEEIENLTEDMKKLEQELPTEIQKKFDKFTLEGNISTYEQNPQGAMGCDSISENQAEQDVTEINKDSTEVIKGLANISKVDSAEKLSVNPEASKRKNSESGISL